MAFLGAHSICKVCGRRAFFTEQVKTPGGDAFHRGCFLCKQCQKPLDAENYASVDGVLYCKLHAEQSDNINSLPAAAAMASPEQSAILTKSPTPNLDDELLATPPSIPTIRKLQSELSGSPRKAASFKFLGTQEKCITCSKTVYPLEKVSVEGSSYHKTCFKCLQGGCSISPSNYAAMEGRLYCKHHFKQLFKEKGNYSQLLVKVPSSKLP
ncbi:hypothetical protein KP509_07G010100 [Ceratopteris richardii]|uniref:LIM zinc-binding domain-containing protein n=1 Tax=Ceratopteris richardii TaxID=49495 RepID=A0A8T2UC77_CERRI|nr:hypothetical protein KP509_07G010100 [Ceratopteris richardii]KAH7432140.1 hypothetical protein KP509_07G010100 [Ceratopteris richardii]